MAAAPDRRWYAVRTRANFEHKAQAYCEGRELVTFLPTYRRRSRKHGGPEFLERPLFPGYLFARVDLGLPERVEVLRAPGAVELVRFGAKAAPIPDSEIESVRIVSQPGSGAAPHPFLKEGMRVRVVAGPFAGAEGILVRAAGRKPRLVVAIELLGRAVGVPIEPESIEPAT